MSRATIETLLGPEFRLALGVGAVAALLCAAAGSIWRRRGSGPASIGGLVLATALLVAQYGDGPVPRRLVLGLIVLAAAGLVPAGSHLRRTLAWSATVVGAWMVVSSTGISLADGWLVLGIAAVLLLAIALSRGDSATRDAALGLPLFALSVIGIFFAIPDTEDALVLMGVSLPMAVNGWPIRLASLGGAGAHVVVGLSVWTIIRGGYVRPSSMLGALACLGVLAAILTGWGRASAQSHPLEVLGIITFHLGLVFVASRVVAVQSVGVAGTLATALVLVALIVGRGIAGLLGADKRDGGARQS